MVHFTVQIDHHFYAIQKQPFSKHGLQNTNTMNNLILEAINYISKSRNKKVTGNSISSYLNNEGTHNTDNKSSIGQLQGKGLINQLYRPIDTTMISKAPHSTLDSP